MMSMHILQLGPFPPPVGGVTRNMLAIRDELRSGGNKCSIIATTKSTDTVDEPDVYHPGSAWALIKQIRTLKCSILHLHIGGDLSARVLALAFICSLLGRNKSVLTLHSGAYPQTAEARSAKRNSIRGMIFRRFSRLIAVNDAIADVFLRFGVPADDIRIILPYSLKMPDPSVAVPKELKDFFDSHSPVLLAVGGLEPDYDPLFQIAAMKEILTEFPNAGLMIVGDGSMRAEVEAAIHDSGYSESIFLSGNVEHEVTLHLINDADVLLRTTLFDGDAISVREALHLGTPVIATDSSTRPDGVRLIRSGDRNGLTEAVRLSMKEGETKISTPDDGSENISTVIELYKEML